MAGKKQMDLISGSLGDKILRFALPLAATGILQQLFNAADIAVIGRFVGKHAMAAVGSNAPVIGLLVNLFMGISMGANVVIARYTGQQDYKNVKKAVHTAIVVAVVSGFFVTVVGELVTPSILSRKSLRPMEKRRLSPFSTLSRSAAVISLPVGILVARQE